ncbi:DUF2945 domain-containing protein [Deinococcus maricopensis]|uniref:Hypervirulence associated protein TUDOR domain-containing protein n=1 Tax=Deinococcus maricopensis (strain DSM 21211 / LMG 22137 / NRRL B-23946 / LB-34) TaxID=709986 RepID=E8U3Z7_DEIML|nr:DUF2945 domain-containing protein [Deinococcus maricopensis]ADV65691.1 hypothetical protein Deima_0027 [Deinococcus maricopensis DSM 21211]
MALNVGDHVTWRSHNGEAHGRIIKVAHQDGEVNGFHYHATHDDPRYIVETDDGRRAAHTAGALRKR